ncbi:MAG: S-layer homology domain-containing protein [Oscillospiraceae bacterium]|nr:S-layer homology domain-containing protein [Oscillospiraceae bacterium]
MLALCMCVGLLPVTASAETDREFSEILEAALQIIYTNEGSYSSVNADDNGAVSVGKLQWHGNRALSLLKTICEANPEQALELLGEDLYNEITTASAAAWGSRTVNSTEKEAISSLLSTAEGQAAQDTLAAANVTNYIENGIKLGIVNGDALVYFADLENNGGSGASKRIATAAAAVQGSFDQVTLLSLYNATLEDSVMGKSLYLLRRYRTYTYCRNLGWTTATLSTPTLSVDSTAIDGSVTLSWTESSGADGYYIYRASGKTSYAYTLAGTVTGGGTTTYTDTVTEEGNYYYRIIAYQGVNQSGESNQAPVTVEIGFTDVSASSYYYDAVVWALENGITNGTDATTFSPDDGCTRAQFATFLYRLAAASGADMSYSIENPFSDVVEGEIDADYYTAILWAYDSGITNGTSATTFTPGDAITREDAVTMLYRYATLVNGGTAPTAGSSNPFSDVVNDKAHAYSYNAILWAYGQEITNGTSSTTFSPGDTCERAMMVTFLYRFVNSASYLSADGSVSSVSAVSETVDAAVGAETDAVSEEDSAVSGGEAAAAEDGEIEEADAVSEGQEEPLLEE